MLTSGKRALSSDREKSADNVSADRKTSPLLTERNGTAVENRRQQIRERSDQAVELTGYTLGSWDSLLICDECAAFLAKAKTRQDAAAQPNETATERVMNVYFIGSDHGPIKIGRSVNPDARLKELQTGHAHALKVLASIPAPGSAEIAYHNRFAAHRLHGEWFERCPEIEAEIARLPSINGGAA